MSSNNIIEASFVIVNYNRKDELLLTIQKTKDLIKGYRNNYELVIVDNGSTDGSAAAVAKAFPDVVLIAKNDNIGAPAWNEGFEKANGDYFIILDDDSHIESGLEEALHYMQARPKIGVLALNILTGPYTSAGWNMQEGKNIIGFIGCGAILRRETYEKIGGYADWIFLYVNEWELGLRCTNAGYDVQYFDGCKVTHRTSNSHRSTKRLDVFVTKHELAIIYKYFPRNRWKYMSRVTINNLKRVIRAREFRRVWYTIVGLQHFWKMKPMLGHTPVSAEAQKLYIKSFPGTRESAFAFITKHFKKAGVSN
jgi:GT2 family glycosyltransferase